MADILTIDGKKYIRIKGMLFEVDENGKIRETWSENKPNASGGMDCTVHVNCLQIAASKPKVKE